MKNIEEDRTALPGPLGAFIIADAQKGSKKLKSLQKGSKGKIKEILNESSAVPLKFELKLVKNQSSSFDKWIDFDVSDDHIHV